MLAPHKLSLSLNKDFSMKGDSEEESLCAMRGSTYVHVVLHIYSRRESSHCVWQWVYTVRICLLSDFVAGWNARNVHGEKKYAVLRNWNEMLISNGINVKLIIKC